MQHSINEQRNTVLKILSYSIILFWALWSSLVALTDSINLLQAIGELPKSWNFTSGNYDLVAKSISIYGLNSHLLSLTFFSVIVLFAWLVAGFLWRAVLASKRNYTQYLQKCYAAFLLIFAIEAFFILADEIFIQYDLEHGHMDRLGFKLITFLAFLAVEKIRQSK